MAITIISRATSAGLLTVDLGTDGRLVARLAGGELFTHVNRLPKAILKDDKTYTHSMGSRVAILASEAAAIEAARAAWQASPRGQRAALTDRLEACDRGAFPGTRAHREEGAALAALQAFDRAHPEVLAEIEAEHRERVLGGLDVGGL